MPETLSVKETASRLGIGQRLTYKLVNCGKLPACRFGKVIRISRIAVDKLVQEGNYNA
jgi:excisionase family DNA binding protein